jgi:hypothetical protein
LLIVAEVYAGGRLMDRTFYWTDYEAERGCLFRLPATTLSLHVQGHMAIVRNTGASPAVAVELVQPGHLDSFTANDNFFWLEPGEEKVVATSSAQGLSLHAWNVQPQTM